MNKGLIAATLAAAAALALLAACADTAASSGGATDQLAALQACQTQAEAARDAPEGRGLVGSADYDRYVAECLRASRVNP